MKKPVFFEKTGSLNLPSVTLKPIRWRSLPRDFAVIQIGFALFGLAIAILIRANLGTSP
jgi:hypothetical protein